MFYRRKVWRHCRPWQWLDSTSLEVIQHNMSAMGTGIVILEAKTIPMGSCKGHDKRFNDVISVAHTSNSALAYVKSSSLIGCDTTPNCYTATSITIMWKVGCIKISLPRRRQTLCRPSQKSNMNHDSSENITWDHWPKFHLWNCLAQSLLARRWQAVNGNTMYGLRALRPRSCSRFLTVWEENCTPVTW